MSSNPEQPICRPLAPPEIADPGKVRIGMGFKILPPAKAPADVSDSGKNPNRNGVQNLLASDAS